MAFPFSAVFPEYSICEVIEEPGTLELIQPKGLQPFILRGQAHQEYKFVLHIPNVLYCHYE